MATPPSSKHHVVHVTTAKTKHPRHKTVKVKHHHVRAYRKRHYGLLLLSFIGGLLIFSYVLEYNFRSSSGVESAKSFLSHLLQTKSSTDDSADKVNSTYGFSLSYDPLKFYASGIDSVTGGLFIGDELNTNRAYEVLRFSSTLSDTKTTQSNMTLTYHKEITMSDQAVDYVKLEKTFVTDVKAKNKTPYTQQSSTTVMIDNVSFRHSVWTRTIKAEFLPNFNVGLVTLTGVVHGKPIVIEVNTGVVDTGQPQTTDYDTIINSLYFGPSTQAAIVPSAEVIAKTERSRSFLDRLLLTGYASAAAAKTEVSPSEKNSALYSPAVVKIYNVFCMDIDVDGQPFLVSACDASSGSGFFINGDGYLGTNGHVASSSPKDIAIYNAVVSLYYGNEQEFDRLAQLANTHRSDPEYSGKTNAQILDIAVNKMYGIADNKFTAKNDAVNLLVDLNEKQPDVEELLKVTKERKLYSEQDSIKRAKVIGTDFRTIDGDKEGFKASDVAIIKIDGNNFPTVKLGSLASVNQGSNIGILGYPGNASNNGLVNDKESKVTLTSGKVSAIKNANGSSKKLIETDTTIGHGNSGGPTLNDMGEVVGIATYTADGSGSGNGVFNYIRDIQDLKDLAQIVTVTPSSTSATQKEWEKAINLFYTAHYSKALKSFDKVKALYPQHPTVDSLKTTAEERIKSGQDVKDFPIAIVIAGVVIVGVGAVALFMILKHKKIHNIYKTHVQAGAMQPLAPGATPQQLTYNAAQTTPLGQPANIAAPQSVVIGIPPTVVQPGPAPVIQPTVVTPTGEHQSPPAQPSA